MKNTNSIIKQTELVSKRQEQILNAASKLFVKKGYHKTTIRDIARESGLGIGPIYDYVKNKEDILFMVLKAILDRNYNALKAGIDEAEDPGEKLRGMIETLFDVCIRYQKLFLFMYQESHLLCKSMQKKILANEKKSLLLFEQVLNEGEKEKIFRKSNHKVGANLIVLLIHGWVLKRWDLKDIKKESRLKYTLECVFKTLSV